MKKFTRLLLSGISLITTLSLFSQETLLPPDSLHSSQVCDEILLEWVPPQQNTYEILGYNVYLGDSLLTFTDTTFYQTYMRGNGYVVFNVSTLYDAGESIPASDSVELVIYAPATDLNYDTNECFFSWRSPQGNLPYTYGELEEDLHWSFNYNYDAIGTGSAAEFDCAAVWSPDQLAQYKTSVITVNSITFFPAEENASYNVRVWSGNWPWQPDTLLYDQAVISPSINQFNQILLNNPVSVDSGKYLWVGYHVNTQTGFPAGVDEGPAINGSGNMFFFQGEWHTLLDQYPDLNYNWNIKANISYYTVVDLYYDLYGQWRCHDMEVWAKLNESPVYDTSLWYVCLNTKHDLLWDLCFVQVNYCGVPVNSDTSNFQICWASGVDEEVDLPENKFYITAAPGKWMVHSDDVLEKVILYDLSGKALFSKELNSQNATIDNNNYSQGLYILKGTSGKSNYTLKVLK